MADITAADIAHAASILTKTALRLKAGERFVVVSDEASSELGEALGASGEASGASVTVARLDILRSVSTNHSGDRPHKVLPDVVRRAMLGAQASAFVASAPHGELSMREQLLHIVGACNVRHAHMPGITTQSFARGLRVDFDEVERAGKALQRRLEGARQISVESSGGTNLTLTFGDSRRWTAQLGVIAPGTSVAFPAGALFAAPEAVDGVFVADASIGEFFGAREGLLSAAPVRFRIAGGLVTAVEAPGLPQLQAELEALLAVASHSNRIGAVAVGVNGGLAGAVGDASVDSTLPGLHLVVGDPAGRVPGVKWSARTSFLACGAGATVRAGNDTIVASGALA